MVLILLTDAKESVTDKKNKKEIYLINFRLLLSIRYIKKLIHIIFDESNFLIFVLKNYLE
jgi:hypothetical protein